MAHDWIRADEDGEAGRGLVDARHQAELPLNKSLTIGRHGVSMVTALYRERVPSAWNRRKAMRPPAASNDVAVAM